MGNKKQQAFQQARHHAKKSCQEIRAMFKCLLPQAFWNHAQESKKEAELAARAIKQMVNKKCCKRSKKKSPVAQQINIA